MAASKPLITGIDLNARDILEVSKEIGSAFSEAPNPEMKWDEFAMTLMGNDSRNNGNISQIKQRNNDFGDRCKALLGLWKQTTIEDPRWDRVEAVLREIGLNEPVRKLRKAIASLNSSQLPLRENDHAYQPTSQGETANLKEPEKQPDINEEELKQKYKDKFPDNAITRKKPGDDDLKKQRLEILIQTVNKREFYAVMIKLKNVSMYTVTTTEYPDETYYYVGKWGDKGIPVMIIQTAMGGDGVHGSYNETRKALNYLPNLKYIFAVGVCGGAKGKVKLGDVVVSKVLQDCSVEVYEAGKVTTRSYGWSLTANSFYYFLSQAANTPDIVTCGMVLSANKLLKDYDMQKKLLAQFPEAKAFEMEGHGIGRACEETKKREIEFLVVKGVSDLADEDKNDDWQPQAAVNAADALYEVMAKYHAFDYGEDYGSSTSVAAEKEQTEQGRSHQQIEDQNDMQDAEMVQGAQENVNVQDKSKTKDEDDKT